MPISQIILLPPTSGPISGTSIFKTWHVCIIVTLLNYPHLNKFHLMYQNLIQGASVAEKYPVDQLFLH